jgi:hypothetical protein
MATIGLGMFGLGALRLPGWARQRATQMDEVAARLEVSAKSRMPELPVGSSEPPTLSAG